MILTLTTYKEMAPSFHWGAEDPSICFSIFPFHFMEPGEFSIAEEWLKKVWLVLQRNVALICSKLCIAFYKIAVILVLPYLLYHSSDPLQYWVSFISL
jgi:hypothetical protein